MDDLRTRLAEQGERRTNARADAADASEQITALARQAHADGIPKVEIARLAQISRPALDAMLKD